MESLVYLASRSPRRRDLLQQIGIGYRLLETQVDETPQAGEEPSAYVVRLAREKASAAQASLTGQPVLPVLAADTAVVVDGRILGKPADRHECLQMLSLLSGRSHRVYTGVALAAGKTDSRLSISEVSFRTIRAQEAETYWRSGEPLDKAGGYGIQGLGAIFVNRLCGSYSGVMGLPLFETAELLGRAGIFLLHENNQQDVHE